MSSPEKEPPPELVDAPISPRDTPSRSGCRRDPPADMLTALEEFNRGEYWEQHETLERLWRGETDSTLKNLYKGIIQVGVGFYHLRGGNLAGALKVLARGITYLRPYAPECCGVDVEQLLQDATRVYWRAVELGEARVSELEMEPLPRVKYAEPGAAGDA